MAAANLLKDRSVHVIGIGLHRYQRASETPYVTLGLTAVREALKDAGVEWRQVDTAYVGNARIGMAAGSTMLRYLGPSNVAVVQVENASASGSSAFRQAVHDVASGLADISIAIGVDKPVAGAGRGGPINAQVRSLADGLVVPFTHFAMLTERYMADTGATAEQIAKVAVKNHGYGAKNPYAQRQKARTLEEVLAPPVIAGPLTRLQCTPVGEGGAATIVASESAIQRLGLTRNRAVRVTASASRLQEFTPGDNPDVVLTRNTTLDALEAAGVAPAELDVIELHDAFSIEELLYAEAMGLCGAGEAAERLERGEFNIGGKHAISPSGGLLAMGHPIGPTGVGQVCEIVRQLRGEAGARQHPDARIGLAHMVGVGAVCVVHVLQSD
ncbi:MAG: thiolase family protein [Pseudomonadota bacterium]